MSPGRLATMMRANVLTLSDYLRSHGEVLNVDIWGAVIAAVLDCEPRGKYRLGNHVRIWPGLDAETLANNMRQLGFATYDIDGLLASAASRKRKIGPAEIGRRLYLTTELRAELKIRNIEACDQTAIERRAAAKLGI